MLLAFPAEGLLVLVLELVVALGARVLVVVPVDPVPVLAVVLLVVPVDPLVPVDTRLPVPAAAPSLVLRCPVRVCPAAVLAVAPVVPVAEVLAVVPVVVARARSSVSRAASGVVPSKSSSPAASLATKSRPPRYRRVKSSSSVGSARRSWAPS